jgi:hypothetical protein
MLLSLFSSDLASNIQCLPYVTGVTAWAALCTECSEGQRSLLQSLIGTIEAYEGQAGAALGLFSERVTLAPFYERRGGATMR